MWRNYFAVATGTTISGSLGRQYGPVFSLSFLDVYASNLPNLLVKRLACQSLRWKADSLTKVGE
jgi:hypothetical protein